MRVVRLNQNWKHVSELKDAKRETTDSGYKHLKIKSYQILSMVSDE